MAYLQFHFFSHVLSLACTMDVLLPEAGWTDPGPVLPVPPGPYPTLYLLHGLSDDHTLWQRRTAIERYVERRHLAVVMPAVDRSFYADMADGRRYWTYISEEVPAVARGYLNLSARREDNFVAGLSMGGYGAFKLALTHPSRFAAAASLSGVLDVVRRAQLAQAGPPTLRSAEMRRVFGDAGALAGGPNDLFHLAEQVAHSAVPRPALYQWCGTEDTLMDDNAHFYAHLQRLGLAVTYAAEPGTHEWVYWDRQIEKVLDWLPLPPAPVTAA